MTTVPSARRMIEVHADVTWRPLRSDDGPAWVELVTAVEAVDHFGETFGLDDFEEFTTAPGFDPGRDGVAVVDPTDRLVAYGWAQGPLAPGGDGYRIELWGGVHPDFRARGIGRQLLARTEQQAATILRERHPDQPGTSEVRVLDFQSDRVALCQRAGYVAERHWFDMERQLRSRADRRGDPNSTALVAAKPHGLRARRANLSAQTSSEGTDEPGDDTAAGRPVPPGLRLVPYDRSFDAAVLSARNESFADHWGSVERSAEEWAHYFTGARHFRPDLSFCVRTEENAGGGEVAAFALSQVYPEDFEALGWTEAWLGQLGTRRAWRGQGLASALLRRVVVAYRDAGFDRAALSVDSSNATGALGVYEREGFRTRVRAITYGKPLPTV